MFIAYILVLHNLAKSREEIAPHLTDLFSVTWRTRLSTSARVVPATASQPTQVLFGVRVGDRTRPQLRPRFMRHLRHSAPAGRGYAHAQRSVTQALSVASLDL